MTLLSRFFILSSVLAFLSLLQGCGTAVPFEPLTAKEVKILKDAGDDFTEGAVKILHKFGSKNVDLKTACEAALQAALPKIVHDQKTLDKVYDAQKKLKDKKDNEALIALLDKAPEDEYTADYIKVDVASKLTTNSNFKANPLGTYANALDTIIELSAALGDKFPEVQKDVYNKADMLTTDEYKKDYNAFRDFYLDPIIAKLVN